MGTAQVPSISPYCLKVETWPELNIQHLSKKFEKDIDEGLSDEQKNVQHAMIKMVENHLAWIVGYWKTSNIDNMVKGYKMNLQAFTGSKMPNGLISFAFKHMFLRKANKRSKSAGLSGYSDEEIEAQGKSDCKVLSDLLGDKQF